MTKISRRNAVLTIVILALICSIYSSLHPGVTAIPADNDGLVSSANSNVNIPIKTTPVNSYSQKRSLDAQSIFWTFLNKVAGINTTNCLVSKFRLTPITTPRSYKSQLAISAVISKDSQNMGIAMTLIEGKVTFYKMELLSGNLEGQQLDVNSALRSAKNMISAYQNNFNTSSCNEFDHLVPTAIKTAEATIESQKTILDIQVNNKTLLNFISLNWFNKIGDISVHSQSIQSTLASTGVLTFFANNIDMYKIATQDTISKESALGIALQYINEYASEKGRSIESVESNFNYISDINSTRGDCFLIYPQWTISAKFTKSQDGVQGYTVCLWGDNGEVTYKEADFCYKMTKKGSSYENLIALGPMIIFMSICFLLAKKKQVSRKYYFLKISGTIILISLIMSPSLIQSSLAYPSSAYSGTFGFDPPGFPEIEQQLHNQIVQEISDMASQTAYTPYTYTGSSFLVKTYMLELTIMEIVLQ